MNWFYLMQQISYYSVVPLLFIFLDILFGSECINQNEVNIGNMIRKWKIIKRNKNQDIEFIK